MKRFFIGLLIPLLAWTPDLSAALTSPSQEQHLYKPVDTCVLVPPMCWWQRQAFDRDDSLYSLRQLIAVMEAPAPPSRAQLLRTMDGQGIRVQGSWAIPTDYLRDLAQMVSGIKGQPHPAIKNIRLIPWLLVPFFTAFSFRRNGSTNSVVIPVLPTRRSFRWLAAHQLGKRLPEPRTELAGRHGFMRLGVATGMALLSTIEESARVIRRHTIYRIVQNAYTTDLQDKAAPEYPSRRRIGRTALFMSAIYAFLAVLLARHASLYLGLFLLAPIAAVGVAEWWVRAWMIPSSIREFGPKAKHTPSHRFQFVIGHSGAHLLLAILVAINLLDTAQDPKPWHPLRPLERFYERARDLWNPAHEVGEKQGQPNVIKLIAPPKVPPLQPDPLLGPVENSTPLADWNGGYQRWFALPQAGGSNLGSVPDPFLPGPPTSSPVTHLSSYLFVHMTGTKLSNLQALQVVINRSAPGGVIGFHITAAQSDYYVYEFRSTGNLNGNRQRFSISIPDTPPIRPIDPAADVTLTIEVTSGRSTERPEEHLPLLHGEAPKFKVEAVHAVWKSTPLIHQQLGSLFLGQFLSSSYLLQVGAFLAISALALNLHERAHASVLKKHGIPFVRRLTSVDVTEEGIDLIEKAGLSVQLWYTLKPFVLVDLPMAVGSIGGLIFLLNQLPYPWKEIFFVRAAGLTMLAVSSAIKLLSAPFIAGSDVHHAIQLLESRA